MDTQDKAFLESLQRDFIEEKERALEEAIWSDAKLLESDLPPVEWLIPRMMPSPSIMAISGVPSSYKTWFAMWMGRRLAAGRKLFDECDMEPFFENVDQPPVRVLFVEEEMNKRQVKGRASVMASFDRESFYWLIGSGFKVTDPAKMEMLATYMKKMKIKVLFLDPFSSVFGMKDENNNAEAAEVMDAIRRTFVDSEVGATVVFIHHPSKGDDSKKALRGAGDILGKCDMHLCLERKDPINRIVEVSYAKNRDIEDDKVATFRIQFVDSSDTTLLGVGKRIWKYLGTAQDIDAPPKNETMVLEGYPFGQVFTQDELAAPFGLSRKSTKFQDMLKRWEADGKFIKTKKGYMKSK
jgi:hypothetical protein